MGFAGVERAQPGVPLPTGKYYVIVPQEDLTITSISISPGFTSTNYNGETLAAGIPFYVPFTTAELTGKAEAYKTARVLSTHEKTV